jgi:hypothetical protein
MADFVGRAQGHFLLQLNRRISENRNFPEGYVQPQTSQRHPQAAIDFTIILPTLLSLGLSPLATTLAGSRAGGRPNVTCSILMIEKHLILRLFTV